MFLAQPESYPTLPSTTQVPGMTTLPSTIGACGTPTDLYNGTTGDDYYRGSVMAHNPIDGILDWEEME